MTVSENLPTGLWVEAKLRELDQRAVSYYYIQKGNHASGIVLVKYGMRDRECCLQIQQRNFMNDTLEWVDALGKERVSEREADDYIRRSITHDPDLWVLEIEEEGKENPFLKTANA